MSEEDVANEGTGDDTPAVPTDLLELHLLLEQDGTSPEAFKDFVGDQE